MLRDCCELVQVGVGVVCGDGREPGVQGEAVGGCAFELRCCLLVRGAVVQGEFVPELPEPGFLVLGEDPVRHRVADALFPSRFQGLVDGGAVPVGPAGYLCQGEAEGFLVEGAGRCGLGGEIYHLVPAGLVGPAAALVFAAEYARLLVTEGAGAGGRFQEVGEGHGLFKSL